MFACRVAIGEYCKGVLDALAPPTRYGNVLFDTTVDDVSDPGIYVTYHDVRPPSTNAPLHPPFACDG